MRLLLTAALVAAFLEQSIAEKFAGRLRPLSTERSLQVEVENCPTTFSLMHCKDPTKEHDIPCDETTCLWDTTALQASAPPGICGFIRRIDINDDLPDDLKPCVLWNQFFGTLPPTRSPKPTEAPVPMPTTDSPTASPTSEVRIFKLTLDRKIINLFFRSPSGLVNQALNDSWTLQDLEVTINQYVQQFLRTRTGHDIATESVLVLIEDAFAPWKNATAVATLALTTKVKSDSSNYEKHEFHLFVADALREESLLRELQQLGHAPFERAYRIHVGPLYLEDAPSRDIQADRPTGKDTNASYHVRWWSFWKKEFWQTIQWGDWTDKDFIAFAVVVAVFVLFICLFASIRCRRRRRAYKLEQDVLSAAKLTMDEGSVIYAANDLERSATGATSEFPLEESSIRSETYSYAEEDSRDIQSFSVDPGTNMSALDFSISKFASPPESTKLLPPDAEDEDDSVGSRSTISHQPVDLEQGKGTVVCYDIDNDSLSTTSDSMIGSMLDFVRAAWQKKKPHSPQQRIFNQRIPKVPVTRNTQSSVMAVVASLEAAAKSTSPKPPSPRKINLLSVVEEIERENQQPVELESQGGTVSQTSTAESTKKTQGIHSVTSTTENPVDTVSSQSPEDPAQKSVSSFDPAHTELATPDASSNTIELPVTPEKQAPPPRKLTLESHDDDGPTNSVLDTSSAPKETDVSDQATQPSIGSSKKPGVLAVAAAFEKISAEAATQQFATRPKKTNSVMAVIASFEQTSKTPAVSPPRTDFASKFRELASKKAISTRPSSVKSMGSPVPEKADEPKESIKIYPVNSQSVMPSPVKVQKSPISILKPTVTKRSGSVMDAIKAFESRSPIPIEQRPKPIKQSVSFDDSLPSLSRMSQSLIEETEQEHPPRDFSSPVRLSRLMDDAESNSTKKTAGTSSTSSASECISPSERNKSSFVLRTNIDGNDSRSSSSSPAPNKESILPFFRSRSAQRERSKSDVSPEQSILRSWSDKPPKESYLSPAFNGNSVRKSKASRMLLSDDSDFIESTPATLPATPLTPIEYEESETSDIKSICSKECFGVTPMR